MSKHTPGPWEPMVGCRSGKVRGIRAGSVNVVNFNGISRPMSDEGQANARLMLAATDMREVLGVVENNPCEMIAMFEREGFVFDGSGGRWEKLAFTLYSHMVDTADKAAAIISKAEGK